MSRHETGNLTDDAPTPDAPRPHERPSQTTSRGHAPDAGSHGRAAALRFIGRIALLDLDDVAAIVSAWQRTMRTDAEAWFAAEEALGRAVVTSGRHGDQKPLLMHVADAFTHLVWYGDRARRAAGDRAPELRVRATESSGQYLATVAMLAVLVRDHLSPALFALLYAPFAPFIPPTALDPE